VVKDRLLKAMSVFDNVDGPDHATSVRDQLERGYSDMRFERSLELAYRHDQFYDSLKYLRINLSILMVLIVIVVQLDRVVMPDYSAQVPAVARLGVMLPMLAIALALTNLRRASIWYPRVMAVLMVLALMGISWIGLYAWTLGENRVFVRSIIAVIATYFVIGLRFRLALAGNMAALVFFAAAGVWWAVDSMVLTQFLAMLVMTSVICAAGAYNLEHARRTAWLEGRLLSEMAMRDGLTGIPNRRRHDEHLQQAWQQGLRDHKPVALLFSDIDYFKAFNDRYGHQAGDEALKAVAQVHARFGRRPLDMAARFGGEEFAVVLFDTSRDDALRIAHEIMEAVRGLGIAHDQSSVASVLTTSIGIACVVPDSNRSCADLLLWADRALYAAKNGGRNQARLGN